MLEALTAVGVIGKGFRKNFEGDETVHACLFCFVDFAHAPCAYRGKNLVVFSRIRIDCVTLFGVWA
jgi:hypothetical protein